MSGAASHRRPAAEWLLDNFHIISAAARDIRHDLPAVVLPAPARSSPTTSSPDMPRVYALALELIRCERRPSRRAAAAAVRHARSSRSRR